MSDSTRAGFTLPGHERVHSTSPIDTRIDSPLDEGVRVIRHAIVNCSGLFVTAAVAMVLVPVMLRNLGRPMYGLWIAMESTVAMLARIDLGVPWAVTREVATTNAGGFDGGSRRFIGAAGGVSILLGLAGWLCLAALGGPIGAALAVPSAAATRLFGAGGSVLGLP